MTAEVATVVAPVRPSRKKSSTKPEAEDVVALPSEGVSVVKQELPKGISKASLKRLAQDAGQKMPRDGGLAAAEVLVTFVSNMAKACLEAMEFSSLKSLTRQHVMYAAKSLKMDIPVEFCLSEGGKDADEELIPAPPERLHRCDPHEAVAQRKQSLWDAEISSAGFLQLLQRIFESEQQKPRIRKDAVVLLHALAELHLLRHFASTGATKSRSSRPPLLQVACLPTDASERALAVDAIMTAFNCDRDCAERLNKKLSELCARASTLLEVSSGKLFDCRLVRAAAKLGDSEPLPLLPPSNHTAVKFIEKMLRGRLAPGRRVAAQSAQLLAALLVAPEGLHFEKTEAVKPPVAREIAQPATRKRPLEQQPSTDAGEVDGKKGTLRGKARRKTETPLAASA